MDKKVVIWFFDKANLEFTCIPWTALFFYQNLEMRLNGFFFLLFGAFFLPFCWFFFGLRQINQSCYIFPVLFHYQFFFIEQGMTFLWVLFSFHRPQITVKAQWGIFKQNILRAIIKKIMFFKKLVFCYQNCSDLLWEKIVLVTEKNFWNLRLKAENFQNFWDH